MVEQESVNPAEIRQHNVDYLIGKYIGNTKPADVLFEIDNSGRIIVEEKGEGAPMVQELAYNSSNVVKVNFEETQSGEMRIKNINFTSPHTADIAKPDSGTLTPAQLEFVKSVRNPLDDEAGGLDFKVYLTPKNGLPKDRFIPVSILEALTINSRDPLFSHKPLREAIDSIGPDGTLQRGEGKEPWSYGKVLGLLSQFASNDLSINYIPKGADIKLRNLVEQAVVETSNDVIQENGLFLGSNLNLRDRETHVATSRMGEFSDPLISRNQLEGQVILTGNALDYPRDQFVKFISGRSHGANGMKEITGVYFNTDDVTSEQFDTKKKSVGLKRSQIVAKASAIRYNDQYYNETDDPQPKLPVSLDLKDGEIRRTSL